MKVTAISSRELNQDVSKAKRATLSGPVFITDRGKTTHVLLTIDEYRRITDKEESIIELLAMAEAVEIDFEPSRLDQELYHPADLS